MNRLRCRRRRTVPGYYGQLFRYVALLRSLCTLACGQFSGLSLNGDHHIGVDRCGHNVFWIKGSGRQNLFDLCNGLLGRGGHDRTEVACRLAVHQVAFFIGLERFDQCDVTVDRVLQHIVATVDLTNFFAFGQPGPVTGWCKESANACTGGAEALGKVALWYEVQLNFAGTVGLVRSEEHTSELQSRGHLVCRLLL